MPESEKKSLHEADSKYPSYGDAPGQIEMTPGLQCLARQQAIEVKEKASIIEAVTALMGAEIEMGNKYHIFDSTGQNELFYAVEETGFCTRQMKSCCPDCAPWNLSIFLTEGGQSSKAFELERPATCTCCCFNRPKVNVIDSVSGRSLGSIQDPFTCFDLTFRIRDGAENDIASVRGGCCQCGLCCPLPCGPCAKVKFDFRSEKDADIGFMEKKVPGCCTWLFADDVDNYKVDFGGLGNEKEDSRKKALLMILAVFVDFRYFSNNSNDDATDSVEN